MRLRNTVRPAIQPAYSTPRIFATCWEFRLSFAVATACPAQTSHAADSIRHLSGPCGFGGLPRRSSRRDADAAPCPLHAGGQLNNRDLVRHPIPCCRNWKGLHRFHLTRAADSPRSLITRGLEILRHVPCVSASR